jgi:hypothetical protein
LKDQLVALREASATPAETSGQAGTSKKSKDPKETTVEASKEGSAALRATIKAELKQALEAVEEATTNRDKAAKDMFQLYVNLLSVDARYAWNKIVHEQTKADPYTDLQGLTRKGPRGNVTQVFRRLCHVSPSHRVPQQHGRAGEVLHYECAEETPVHQHLSVCAACGTAQFLHLPTALLVLQPKRESEHDSHERALRRG